MFVVITKGPNDIQMPVNPSQHPRRGGKCLTDAGIDMGEESHGMKMLDGRTVDKALKGRSKNSPRLN